MPNIDRSNAFCKTYMTLQGTEILKQNSKDSKNKRNNKPSIAIKGRRREDEKVVIPVYERW